MSTIGTFTKDADSYRGTLCTLSLSVQLEIRPSSKDHEKAPDYRIFSSAGEIGAAWQRTSATEREYLSCKIDDPLFPAPIFASLVLNADEETYALIWSR